MALTVAAVDTPEANAYSIQVMKAFLDGNIAMQSNMPGMMAPFPMRALDPNVKGVFFQVKNPKLPPVLAEGMKKILKDAGIESAYWHNVGLGDDNIILTFGLP